jgi:type IV pilus assembly protein PilX
MMAKVVSSQASQKGVALFVALIILLVVSLAGVSAIKSGIFHGRMAFNSQAEEMTFQAAETAINTVISEAREKGEIASDIKNSVGAGTLNHCISKASRIDQKVCENTDTIDARSSLKADAESNYIGRRPILNTDDSAFMHYEFSTVGQGTFVQVSMPFHNKNYQEWRKVGRGSGQGQFTVDDGSVVFD